MLSASLVHGLCAGGALAMCVSCIETCMAAAFLIYRSVTLKHRQLLANEICVRDHNEEGSVNYQGNPSGMYGSVCQHCYSRMDLLLWGLARVRSEIRYLGVPSGEGLPSSCFFTAFILTVGSYQGSCSAMKP